MPRNRHLAAFYNIRTISFVCQGSEYRINSVASIALWVFWTEKRYVSCFQNYNSLNGNERVKKKQATIIQHNSNNSNVYSL